MITHTERAARRKQIADAVVAGLSVREAGQKFGVGSHTVLKACRENDVVPRPIHAKPAADTLAIIALLCNTDRGFSSIAAERGKARQYVAGLYHRCVSAGIPVKSRAQGAA